MPPVLFLQSFPAPRRIQEQVGGPSTSSLLPPQSLLLDDIYLRLKNGRFENTFQPLLSSI